jgi:hypothetical protein
MVRANVRAGDGSAHPGGTDCAKLRPRVAVASVVATTLALEPSVAQVKAGFLLPADGEESTGIAAESTVGRK